MDLGYFETSLPVADIVRSMSFYEALGFERAEYAEDAGTATMLRGDCRLGLFQGHLAPARTQLIFWQGDVEAVAAEAGRLGLRPLTPLKQDAEGGAAVMLEDPDGHPLFFIRMKTFYPQYPRHTQAAPAERPAPRGIDPQLGWYEVSLPVKDIGKSVDFYQSLGFHVVVREAKGTRVSVQKDDCRIGLFQGHLTPDQAQLIFWQGDIDALADVARAAGLGFHVAPRGDAGNGSFMLLDPDGHPLFFIHMPGVTRQEAV
jgi:catechol 2,3-dioxygenase-like lactoylglutathione lyase family enzyme